MEYRHVPPDNRNATSEYERTKGCTRNSYKCTLCTRAYLWLLLKYMFGYANRIYADFSFALFMGDLSPSQPLTCHCRRCWSIHLFVSYICICPFFLYLLLLISTLKYTIHIERHDILQWSARCEEKKERKLYDHNKQNTTERAKVKNETTKLNEKYSSREGTVQGNLYVFGLL